MPEGVLVGVEWALLTPILDFLADERGVTLLVTKDLTGVTSSWTTELTRGVLPTALREERTGGGFTAE